jgi:oligosaccharide repeat unit polymerase
MLLVCFTGVLFVLLFEFLLYRNLKSPVFLYGIIWLLVYVSLFFEKDDFIANNTLLPAFLIATILFAFGFRLVNFHENSFIYRDDCVLLWSPVFKKLIFATVYIFAVVAFAKCYSVISVSQFSAWQATRQGMAEEALFPSWVGILFNFVRIVFFISFALYLKSPCVRNRIDVLVSIPPLLLTCLFTTRGDWFLIIITSVYMTFYLKDFSNKKILISGLISFAVIMMLFVYSSLDKYKYVYVEMTEFEKIKMLFSSYFLNPALNFFYWFADNPEYAGGAYTFRFFYAIASSLFSDIPVVGTILEFRCINGVLSNVYTSLNWCARDFGLWWAFFVQFMLGIFYGLIYKSSTKNGSPHLTSTIMLAMLMMPIVNQFFDDTFFSAMSLWLQKILFLILIVKTSVVVERKI